ncbi:uncharacterized protein DS421_1g23370 [Arachis hypogaea]|nr:uncharacterized protein DS421_1g23370 [Arachis hypogaea]
MKSMGVERHVLLENIRPTLLVTFSKLNNNYWVLPPKQLKVLCTFICFLAA